MLKQREQLKNKKFKSQIIWRFFVVFLFLILGSFFVLSQKAQAATTWKNHSDFTETGGPPTTISSMAIFNNTLYIGVAGRNNVAITGTASIWRQKSDGTFEQVANITGFAPGNYDVPSMAVFQGYLYAGTAKSPTSTGLEIWRTQDGTNWEVVIIASLPSPLGFFGDSNNYSAASLTVFNNYLYVGTENRITGAEVWRCSNCGVGGNWAQVNVDGFGVVTNVAALSLKSFGGWLFAGTENAGGAQIRRYNDEAIGGTTWGLFASDLGGDGKNDEIRLETFGSYLYAGTENIGGLEIWRSSNGSVWNVVVGDGQGGGNGFGTSDNTTVSSIYTYSYGTTLSRLVVGTSNFPNGAQIWESTNGTTWSAANAVTASDVLGIANPSNHRAVLSLIAKSQEGQSQDKHLYAGTENSGTVVNLWQRNWAPRLVLSTPSQEAGTGSGKVLFSFEIDDYDGDDLRAKVQYSTSGAPCSAGGNAYVAEVTSSSGVTPTVDNSADYHIYNLKTTSASGTYTISGKWYSKINQPNTYSINTCFRITLYDGFYTAQGKDTDYGNTATFTLDNIPPNPPTLNAVTSPTKTTPQTISGTKDASSSVILNGNTIISINANTTWSHSLNLLEGTNNLSLTSKDNYGNTSTTTTGSIIYDKTAPTCQVDKSGGDYDGQIEVTIEAQDTSDSDPYIFYTTDGSQPSTSSSKAKDKKELTFATDTTLKFFCVDWWDSDAKTYLNKSSEKTEVYNIEPPQMTLTKSATLGGGGAFPVLSLKPFDVLFPTPQKSLQNIPAILLAARDFFTSQVEKFNLTQEFLYVFLRGLSCIILGLTLIYLILVFDTELKKKKGQPVMAAMQEKFGRFSYTLPIILVIFVAFQLLLGFSLIASGDKVKPGETITYTLAYKNIKNKKAANSYVTDVLPSYVDFVSGSLVLNGTAFADNSSDANYNKTYPGKAYFRLSDVTGGGEGWMQFKVRVKDDAAHSGEVKNKGEGVYVQSGNNVNFVSNEITQTVEAQGKISGYVFYDSNSNKVKDSGESGIGGAEAQLYRENYLSQKKNTNDTGYYEFTNVSAGTYSVKSLSPGSNYELTTSGSKTASLATSLETVSNVNFGYRGVAGPTSLVSPTTTISPTTTLSPATTITPTTPTLTFTPTPTPTPFIKKVTKTVEKITQPVKKTVEKIQETIQKILPKKLTEIIQKPISQKTTKNIFTPLLALLPLLNLLTAFPSSVAWQFLRYLFQIFSEPFLYFGKRARRGWGIVYDSLTKQTVDLATIRLYDKASGKLLESKVTDFEGRYIFIVDLGREYYLEVKHKDYLFPSKILSQVSRDSAYNHLYHGEIIATGPVSDIRKKEQGIITFNIPVDPKEEMMQSPYLPHKPIYSKVKTFQDFEKLSAKARKQEDRKMLLALTLRRANYFVGFLGPTLALITLVLVPSWLTFIFFIFHLILLAIFLKLARGKKVLPWGKTFALKTKEGLPNSVVRLFDEKYGRLLSCAVTKSGGRYGFLAGRENYFLIAHKPKYILPKGKIKVKPSRERMVKEDLGMEKSHSNQRG